jgi:hypothetical protein
MRSSAPSGESELILAVTGSPTQNRVLLMEWLTGMSGSGVTMMGVSLSGISALVTVVLQATKANASATS